MIKERFQQRRQHKPQVVCPAFERSSHPHIVGDDGDGQELRKDIQAQECNPYRIPVDGPLHQQRDYNDIAQEFDDGRQQFKYENIRQGEHAVLPVVAVEEHVAVHREELEQAAAPARTLTVEHLEVGRSFRPAAGLGNLDHAVVLAGVAHVADHAGHHVHVLGKGVSVVAAGLDHHLAVEHTKAARHVLHGVDAAEGRLANEEGTGVLQVLEQRDKIVRRAGVHHLAVFHQRAVAHAHGGRYRNHAAGAGHGGPDHAVEGVLLQHAVYVGAHEELVGHHVHAGIGCIGLGAAVHLVHHGEPLEGGVVALCLIEALEGLGLDFLDIGVGDLHQLEVLNEELQRAVLGAVVHDDHLKVRVVQAQERLHIGDNGLFLIVGRCHDGYTGSVRALLELFDGVVVVVIGVVLLVLQERQDSKKHVAPQYKGGVRHHKIAERIVKPLRHIWNCLSGHTQYVRRRWRTPWGFPA